GRRIREDADGFSFHIAGDAEHVVQVLKRSMSFGNAIHDAMHPARSLTAWRALSARLVGEELCRRSERINHGGGLIHYDDAAGPGHGSGSRERIEIHGHVDLIGPQNLRRYAARDDCLQLLSIAHTTCKFD